MTSGHIRVLCLIAADFLAVYASLLLSAFAYLSFRDRMFEFEIYTPLWPLGIIYVVMCAFFRLYHGNIFYPGFALDAVEETRRSVLALFSMFLLFTTFIFFTKEGERYSRAILIINSVTAMTLLPLFKWFVRSALKKFGFLNIRAVIIGAGHTGRLVCSELMRNRQLGIFPFGFLDDNVSCKDPRLAIPLIGKIKDSGRTASLFKIKYAIICLPVATLPDRIRELSRIFMHIMIVPDNRVFPVAWSYPHQIDGIFALELRNQLLLAWPKLLKRIFEFTISLFAVIFTAPVLLVLAALIKLTSPGDVLYHAKRIGLDGKPITIFKFRTMYEDADKRLYELLASNPALEEEWQKNFKLKKDPRITPLGRFLRRTSLDELPQFINVLQGDLAMIGPRPIVPEEIHYYGDTYDILKRVKPGITGLWQVSGRSDTTYERRVNLDIHYIMNWTVWMDYYILLKTVKEVIFCKGAR